MAFLKSPFTPDLPPVLQGRRTRLRSPGMGDYQAWSNLRSLSRDFLAPWEPLWPANDLTRSAFRLRIKQYLRDIGDDMAYPFFIFSGDDKTMLGALTLSNVRRGVAQMATLGYWIGAPFARQGYMTDALQALLPFAFDHLHLHRVEAACLPRNDASIALLRRAGFEQEGLARSYLKINGAWQDHLLFARLR
jgi:[ribosomal protein S5]-alanine N-acetyltransferase